MLGEIGRVKEGYVELTEGGPWISIGSSVVQEEVQSEEGESSDHFFLNFCLTLTQPTNGRQALIIPSSYDASEALSPHLTDRTTVNASLAFKI